MIKGEREQAILAFLQKHGQAAIAEIASSLSNVSTITIRRDIARLASFGLIERSHGAASAVGQGSYQAAARQQNGNDDDLAEVDAIMLAPIRGRGANTLRLSAKRRGIPFLAESAPQDGGTYLGPDNFEAGRLLGIMAGATSRMLEESARVLLISLQELPNTRSRCDGFVSGFTEAYGRQAKHWRVDGQGSYRVSLRSSLDAFEAHPDINVVFGVNDHSILAALEAADRQNIIGIRGYSVGGEGAALFDLLERGRLNACAAIFPEIIGALAVNILVAALRGEGMPSEVRTPHVILEPHSLLSYYQRKDATWTLKPEVAETLAGPSPRGRRSASKGSQRTIGFIPQYPAHDYYRTMIRAMKARAEEQNIRLIVAAPNAGIAREVNALRQMIARKAASYVFPGDTILINAGAMAMYFAEAIGKLAEITVITNAMDIMERLSERSGPRVILTSGEYQSRTRCLVGSSVGTLFATLKADKAFLSVDGISARFGLSASDEKQALVAQGFIGASREIYVLADHSLMGLDANYRIATADIAREVITDSGSLPVDRLAFSSIGVRVTLADANDDIEGPEMSRSTYRREFEMH